MQQNSKLILAVVLAAVLASTFSTILVVWLLQREKANIRREVQQTLRQETDRVLGAEYLTRKVSQEAPRIWQEASKQWQRTGAPQLRKVLKQGKAALASQEARQVAQQGAELVKTGLTLLQQASQQGGQILQSKEAQRLRQQGVQLVKKGAAILQKQLSSDQGDSSSLLQQGFSLMEELLGPPGTSNRSAQRSSERPPTSKTPGCNKAPQARSDNPQAQPDSPRTRTDSSRTRTANKSPNSTDLVEDLFSDESHNRK